MCLVRDDNVDDVLDILFIVKLQSQVQGLGVDFVFPLSQEEQEQPPPKYTRRKHPRSLKFDTKTDTLRQ